MEINIQFAGLDTLGMAIQFGAAGPATHGYHLGNSQNQALGDEAETVGLGETDARVVLHANEQGPFVEWW